MTRIAMLGALAACGRISFDTVPDSSAVASDATSRFCAAPNVPTDAVASVCMDFEDVAIGTLPDTMFFVRHVYAQNSSVYGFGRVEVVTDAIATTHAFRYSQMGTCAISCCYSDIRVDWQTAMLTDRMHFEYDTYIDVDVGGYVGDVQFGSLDYGYQTASLSPPLETGRWVHVEIDGLVGSSQQLVTKVDGVVRGMSVASNLDSGVLANAGAYCGTTAGIGYVDNMLFWGR